jgi:hypothetical protein
VSGDENKEGGKPFSSQRDHENKLGRSLHQVTAIAILTSYLLLAKRNLPVDNILARSIIHSVAFCPK